MKLRELIAKKLGFYINDKEKVSDYFERLGREGRMDSKSRLKIIGLLCDFLDEQQSM